MNNKHEAILGKSYTVETMVTADATAKAVGSGKLEVYATPMMIALMEKAAHLLLAEALEETSVGTQISISHTSASPIGIKVKATAMVTAVHGREVCFDLTASDEAGEIGKGTHTRVIVDASKLEEKAKMKIPSE